MVEVAVCGCGQLQGTEADVVESLVIDDIGFVRVVNQLMYSECRIVRLDHCVRHLQRTTKDEND